MLLAQMLLPRFLVLEILLLSHYFAHVHACKKTAKRGINKLIGRKDVNSANDTLDTQVYIPTPGPVVPGGGRLTLPESIRVVNNPCSSFQAHRAP